MTRRSGHPPNGSPGDADTPGASEPPGAPGVGDRVRAIAQRADGAMRERRFLAVPFAVLKKFGDDRGGQWAALVTYYAFFSLFPLLLVLTTLLGFLVQDDPELQGRILDSALSQFPIIGGEIRRSLGQLEGSFLVLGLGLVGAVWAGMGVLQTLQDAMNDVWDVPRRERPDFFKSRLRSLVGLVALAIAVLASAALAALGTTGGSFGMVLRLVALAGTLAVNVLIFGSVFRYLTVAQVSWRQVLPGAVLAGVAWMGLLAAGSWFVSRHLTRASALYGFFAIVLGLLSWIYLGARTMLLAAEVNVVLARRLWPRSLQPPPLTEADRRVLTAEAVQQEARPSQDVHVHFDDEGRRRDETPDPR